MKPDNDEVRGITLPLLRRYLLAHRWNSQQERAMEVFTQTDQRDVELVLPVSQESPDLSSRVKSIVRALATLQDTELAKVIADILNIEVDVIRSTIPDMAVVHDTIDLKLANDFMYRAKRLLAASATTEINENRRFFGRVRKEGQAYADQCRFGHTFRGSFGFVIESYVGPNHQPALTGIADLTTTPPLGRRVVERLSRGLTAVKEAITFDDPARIANAFESGLSANMCDELVEIFAETQGLTLELSFSPEWPTSSDVAQSERTFVTAQHVEVLAEASRMLRQPEVDQIRELFGRVETLKSERDPTQTAGEREITLRTEMPNFDQIRVRMHLAPTDYLTAIEAHRAGRAISIRGTLHKQGKTWILLDPNALAIALA